MKNRVVAGLLTLALACTVSIAEQQKLRYVIDGDTAVFQNTTCRFAYIDTPESKFNQKLQRDISNSGVSPDEVVRAGRMAKGYVESIMQKGAAYRFDVITTDKYGRSVCVIYDFDGATINDKIVKNGFAVPFWRYIPYNVKGKMITLVREAKANQKGLWRASPRVMEMMN